MPLNYIKRHWGHYRAVIYLLGLPALIGAIAIWVAIDNQHRASFEQRQITALQRTATRLHRQDLRLAALSRANCQRALAIADYIDAIVRGTMNPNSPAVRRIVQLERDLERIGGCRKRGK